MNAALDAAEAGAWRMPHCPEPPNWRLDWPALLRDFAWLRGLAECPQDPVYHAEGDVLIHTRMVCEVLASLPAWRQLQPQARSVLFAAALLHDVGKPSRTIVEADGRISSAGHARAGSRLAQQILYTREPFVSQPVPFAVRAAIVGLVRHHGLPPYLLDRDDPERAVITASQEARCDWLALLAETDVRGRRCREMGDLLDRVALFAAFAQEQGCLTAPRAFASGLSRFLYFQGGMEYAAYDASRCEVVLLSGLPGAGKDTHARTDLADLPMISLDALRAARGVSASGDQGAVIAAARAHARTYLQAKQGFVWNATNISRRIRAQLIALFVAYGARARIVYLEVPYAELLRRNRERRAPVPEAALARMARALEVPSPYEAHTVEIIAR